MNKITKFEALTKEELPELRELWINWNYLESSEENKHALSKMAPLTTLYLADNPISQDLTSDEYQELLTTSLPSLRQIDGNMLRPG